MPSPIFDLVMSGATSALKPEQPSADAQPADSVFDSLLIQESGGRQLDQSGAPVTSRAGAIGIAQVMPGTAPEAAALAGLPWDEARYKGDADYNRALGRAYFEKQLADFGSVPKALAAYNAGPGAVRRALRAAQESGQPDSWLSNLPEETRAYVPAIMKRSGAPELSGGAPAAPAAAAAAAVPRFAPGNEDAVTAGPVASGPTAGDFGREFAASFLTGVGSIGQFIGEGAAAVANAVTGTQDYVGKNVLAPAADSVRAGMTPGGQEALRAAEIKGDILEPSTWELPETADGWAMVAANGLGSVASSLLPMIGPAARVASLTRAGRAAEAAAAARAATVIGAGAGGAQTGGAAAGEVRQTAQASVDAMTHEDLLASVPVYAQAIEAGADEQTARATVVNGAARMAGGLAAVAGAAGGAFNAKIIEGMLLKNGVAKVLGSVGGGVAGRTAVGAAGGVVAEAGQEGAEKVGQNVGENIGLGRDALDDATRNTAGDVLAGGLTGGLVGGPVGAISSPMDAVVAKAAEPNSPLSKAAVSGVAATEIQNQANPPAAPADPAQRMAELESVGSQGGVFTPEQQQEYEALKAARDATPGAVPDDLTPKAIALRDQLRVDRGLLDALRGETSPTKPQALLKDLSIAASKSAQPAMREQALARVEMALEWAAANPAPAVEQDLDALPGLAKGDERPAAPRPTVPQLRAGADRDAELLAERDGRLPSPVGNTARAEADRREQAAIDIESAPGATPETLDRAVSLRQQAMVLRRRADELDAQPGAAGTPGALSERDREGIDAQRQVNLERTMRAPAQDRAAPAAGQDRQQSISATDQARLEAAALAGGDQIRRREDDPRQVVIDRALRNVEERGGVASPAEARIFQEAGVGRPYDRIDESLAPEPDLVLPAAAPAPGPATTPSGIIVDERASRRQDGGQRLEDVRSSVEPTKADGIVADTAPGASPASEPGLDFERDIDTSRLSLEPLKSEERGSAPGKFSTFGGRPEVEIQAARTEGWRIIDDQLPTQEAAERTIRFRKEGNRVVRPSAMWANVELRAVPSDNPGFWAIEARQPGAKKSEERPTTPQALPDVTIPAGAGPAFLRKRKAQIEAAAAQGYETVERRDGVFVMRNAKTGAEVRLSGRADAALAREAVRKMVDERAHAAATSPKNDRKEPSWAQIDAINWKKGDPIPLNGVTVRIENPVGSVRRARPDAPVQWKTTMKHHYGEIAGTKGVDGDPVDVFVGPNPASPKIWVIDQVKEDGKLDEHKVMFGFDSEAAARAGYLSNFSSGWKGLGKITEMTQDEFRAWIKDQGATMAPAVDTTKAEVDTKATVEAAPAADIATQVEPETGSFTVRMDGKNVRFERRGVEALGEQESPERDGRATRIGKRSAALIKAIAGALGKNVQFFSDVDGVRPGDGFVVPSDPDTIYINEVSTINPLAVMGHEFLHTLRQTNPKAWDAIAAVVKTRVKDPKGFRRDYYGADEAEVRGDGALDEAQGGELEELVSDLGGNLMADPKFWEDVFAKIRADNGAEARGIIARLVTALQQAIDKIAAVVKGPKYKADGFVTELDAIRAAYREGLSAYLQESGASRAGMQAEVLKSAQREKTPQTETAAFKKWFGDSKVVDAEGRPLVVYHGTARSFSKFGKAGSKTKDPDSKSGFFFDANPDIADNFTWEGGSPWGGNIVPVHLSIHNPAKAIFELVGGRRNLERAAAFMAQARANGHDGAVFASRVGQQAGTTYVAFRPEQIKSAIGNRGTFDPANPNITKSPERGIHFSKRELSSINGAYYGTGLKGAEAERLRDSNDARLKTRVYAYIDEGNGVRPEAGVGGIAHEVTLPNLYDAKANPEKLWNSGDINATEIRILDAGYAGYFVKKHETGQGFAVVIGDAAKAIPAKRITDPKIQSGVASLPPETVSKGLMSKEMAAVDTSAIPGARMRAGILTIPADSRDAANAEMARIGSPIRFSAERLATAADEIEAVRKKYEGTDQWMKAPNGRPSNLTERQWLHVRTPSFQRWFGPWEKFATVESGVWTDADGEVSKVVDSNGEPLVVYHGTDKGGFAAFRKPGGKKRGDLGIFTTDDMGMARSYVHRGRGRILVEDEINEDGGGTEAGIYALFLNVRKPNESDFEGANWDGSRNGQFVVMSDEGDTLYDDSGRGYFDDRDDAFALVMQKGGNIEEAPDHYEDTDSVVREAASNKRHDGAIIRQVTDEGGGNSSYYGTPADIFVALEPNQVKSATFNSGEYSVDEEDIRKSVERAHARVHEFEVSTRTPYAKATKNFDPEDARANLLISDFAAGLGQEKWLSAVTDLVETYPNYRAAPSATTPEKKLERMVRQMVENLVWLHDQVPASTRARSKLWYDGARAIVDRWVKKYGISDAQAAGILAVLSPQKDWFMNVSLANRVADILTERQAFRWSRQMDETANRIFGKDAYDEDIAEIRGETLQDIDDPYLRAMWVRIYDQAHNPASFYIVSPEGDFVAEARTKDGALGRVAWGGNSTIAKAVSIFEDGSFENISTSLGRMHKVRNFYNNILVPNSPNGHVTIDTHAVAAALLRALSGNSLEVKHNFSGPSSAHAGLKGSYALYEEAYRLAAAERGILPREMQSITWEAIRGLYVPTFKAQKRNVDAVDAVWEQYRKGRLSYEKARQQVFELGGRIDPPSWEGRDPGAYVEDEPAADDGDLAEDGVSAGDAEADGRGSGRRAGAAARRSTERGDGGRRDQGRGLAPLAGAPTVQGAAGPDPRLVEVAEQYARSAGIELRRQAEYVQVDENRAKRIAAAYEAMQHAPQDSKVKVAYEDLARQTRAQYDALVAAGYEAWFMDPENDPYAGNPWNAMRDLRKNQSMAVFPTEAGFGSSDLDVRDNPLLADTGLAWPYGAPDGKPKRVLFNDLFRYVHDAFGHGLEGAGFRAQGEENAWQAHVRLFTGPAVGAITSETRGQNSWLNYGPAGERNRNAKVEDTVFADQKTGLMPEWTWTEGRAADAAAAPPATPPADLVKIFEGMGGPDAARRAAKAAIEAHPLSARIQEIEDGFLDILEELEGSGRLAINCD